MSGRGFFACSVLLSKNDGGRVTLSQTLSHGIFASEAEAKGRAVEFALNEKPGFGVQEVLCSRLDAPAAMLELHPPRPLTDYHEDMGPVLWWRFPVDEAPWCGGPDDSDWPGYHTHFTPLGAVPVPA